jgi:hypothetical protein
MILEVASDAVRGLADFMGRRGRRRRKQAAPAASASAETTDYPCGDGGVLTLRNEVGAGTLRALERLDAKPAASAEDRWQRRVELLFERLVVRWEIAELPLEDQKELLARYRMASTEERRRVREVLSEHLRARQPELEI